MKLKDTLVTGYPFIIEDWWSLLRITPAKTEENKDNYSNPNDPFTAATQKTTVKTHNIISPEVF